MKDKVLELLRQKKGESVPGSVLATELNVSRTTVWKVICELRQEGYTIQAAPNRGYCLVSSEDVLTEGNLYRYMQCQRLGQDVRVYRMVSSTNIVVKELAAQGNTEGLLVVSEEQSAGRGRFGKSFYSPPGTGIYMSFLVRPHLGGEQMTYLTITATVAVAEAIEILANVEPEIKWVNDIMLRGRKVCGILVESVRLSNDPTSLGAVVGIGINIDTFSFPQHLRHIAGSLNEVSERRYTRAQMIATIMARFEQWYFHSDTDILIEQYRRRSAVLGQDVSFTMDGRSQTGRAVDIDKQGRLVVKDLAGHEQRLDSGEISIRPAPMYH